MIGYQYHPAAEAEYHESILYYSRVDAGLGLSFVKEIEAAVERARQFPEAYGKITHELRHVLTHRFSYSILYETLPGEILIWAVMHSSRRPEYWKERMKS